MQYADLIDVVLFDVVLSKLFGQVVESPVFDLILDDCFGHAWTIVALEIKELAKDPGQLLSFADRKVFTFEKVIDSGDLFRCYRQEKVSQRVIVVHHVAEKCRLARLETFDKLRGLLDEFEDCLVSLVLLAQCCLVTSFGYNQVIELDRVETVVSCWI